MPDPELEIATLPATLIRRLHQISVARFATVMSAAGLDLTPVQYTAIAALDARPGIDQATLSGLIGYDRATLGKVVERLEIKQLVQRDICPEDRRARRLRLTERGQSLFAAARPNVEAIQPEILSNLTPEEREALVRLLTKATDVDARGAPYDADRPS
ncbi:MarR family winged helix-turn-helix transcriptional regulator [Tritonibacter sp. SIMBA_163]|uniref:MarR family winged helix-turn-helix transcriptional regulator n=1 Tax=Tritonibacter TaxID=2083206 RepID=UPI00397F7801